MTDDAIYYRRHLPHWKPKGADIFITWRLHGSLPAGLRPPKFAAKSGKQFAQFDSLLDLANTGPLWLSDARVAKSVLAVMHDASSRQLFLLAAYVLMPNHVHVLLTPMAPLDKITRQIKGATARHANLILQRTGTPFWQDESFDHWIRNPIEWQKIRAYIERNPVAAGLVAKPEDWPWSSAAQK